VRATVNAIDADAFGPLVMESPAHVAAPALIVNFTYGASN
jgi:hypothetical protein